MLRALDTGYTYGQIRGGIECDSLGAAGTIDGVEPTDRPVDLVVGFRRTAVEPTPIEFLRQRAQELAEANTDITDTGFDVAGRSGVHLILLLAAHGFTAEQVVDAMVVGVALFVEPAGGHHVPGHPNRDAIGFGRRRGRHQHEAMSWFRPWKNFRANPSSLRWATAAIVSVTAALVLVGARAPT